MATHKFELKVGLKLEDKLYKHVELRAVTAGDVIDAQEESERLVHTLQNGVPTPVLVTSPSLVAVNVLRRQIVRIGNIEGPLDIDVMRKFDITDFEMIQDEAAKLDIAMAATRAVSEVTERGRDDGGGGGP